VVSAIWFGVVVLWCWWILGEGPTEALPTVDENEGKGEWGEKLDVEAGKYICSSNTLYHVAKQFRVLKPRS